MTTPPYPLQPEPMRKSWLERNPAWKIPAGVLILFVLIAAFAVILMTVITTSFRNSDVYKQAMTQAAGNSDVREQIGQPIQPAWLISGELNVSGSTGHANLSIPISGPRGKGVIRAVADKSAGAWKFTSLQVDIAGQSSTIDLLSVPPPKE